MDVEKSVGTEVWINVESYGDRMYRQGTVIVVLEEMGRRAVALEDGRVFVRDYYDTYTDQPYNY